MDHSDYLQELKKLELQFQDKKTELMKEFVRANNPYKVGDKITDHIGSIIIEKLSYTWGYGNKPFATYSGLELKKDGSPTKLEKRRVVHQSNIII